MAFWLGSNIKNEKLRKRQNVNWIKNNNWYFKFERYYKEYLDFILYERFLGKRRWQSHLNEEPGVY